MAPPFIVVIHEPALLGEINMTDTTLVSRTAPDVPDLTDLDRLAASLEALAVTFGGDPADRFEENNPAGDEVALVA